MVYPEVPVHFWQFQPDVSPLLPLSTSGTPLPLYPGGGLCVVSVGVGVGGGVGVDVYGVSVGVGGVGVGIYVVGEGVCVGIGVIIM